MVLPSQYLFTVEISIRWGCSQAQIINWAISDELDIVAAFPTMTIGGEMSGGLHRVAGSDVRPLFRSAGTAAKKVYLKRARKLGGSECLKITEPPEGIKITAEDILITLPEIERFEEAHGIGRIRHGGPGIPPRHDWDGFHLAVFKRLYLNGFPEPQRDLIIEMEQWFIANSTTGEAPDESTIRKRIQTIWHELKMA